MGVNLNSIKGSLYHFTPEVSQAPVKTGSSTI